MDISIRFHLNSGKLNTVKFKVDDVEDISKHTFTLNNNTQSVIFFDTTLVELAEALTVISTSLHSLRDDLQFRGIKETSLDSSRYNFFKYSKEGQRTTVLILHSSQEATFDFTNDMELVKWCDAFVEVISSVLTIVSLTGKVN